MTPGLSHAVFTSAQVWNLISHDVLLREARIVRGWSEQLQKDILGLNFQAQKKRNAGYYLPARVELEIKHTDERAQKLYEACCEVGDIHGIKRNRAFYRAVFDHCLTPLFAGRKSALTGELQLQDLRMSKPGNSSASLGDFARRLDQLRADWNTKLEIETRNNEIKERLLAPTFQSTPENGNHGGVRMTATPLAEVSSLASLTWKELEHRFRELHAEIKDDCLLAWFTRLCWDDGGADERWDYRGGDERVRRRFQSLASAGARKLGFTENASPDNDWLASVRDYVGLKKRITGNGVINGRTYTAETLEIERVADASADYCLQLLGYGTPESTISTDPELKSSARAKPKPQAASLKNLKLVRAAFGALQADLRGIDYCSEIDRRRPQISQEWQDDGWPGSYVQAYRDPKWAKRIQDEKTRLREKYDAMSPNQREEIIQGTRLTRRTRQ